MKTYSFLFAILISMFTQLSIAEVSNEISIVGQVKSFDQKTVTMVSKETTFKIPREMVLLQDLKAGEEIQVKILRSDVEKYAVSK